MAENRKMKAKEPMKPRFVMLFVLIALFALVLKLLGMGILGAVLLGALLGSVSYFFFVVLKVQRLLGQKETPEEAAAHTAAAETAREIARGGIVLLRNEEGLLPLPKGSKLNLVGLRCVQMSFNGGGSAASDESKCVTLESALRQTGFLLNEELLNVSYNYLKNGKASLASPGKNFKVKQGNSQKGGAEFVAKPGAPVRPELPVSVLQSTSLYSDGRTLLAHAKDFSDVALLVLSRGGGEGYDFDPADLRLIESEKKLIEETCHRFEKVILVLNTANTVEMGWLKAYPQIKSVLWLGFPGTAGNLALGDILCGDVNPSGRLPDTWAVSNMLPPAANNFCQLQENGTWSKQSFHYTNAPEKKGYFIHYSEGIYVGYRYFETRAAVDPKFDYDSQVVWPFGYGLSYTQFQQQITDLTDAGEELWLTVLVTNTGKRAGRAVVQCYVSAPYTCRVEKSAVQLAGFAKTAVLEPDEAKILTLKIPKQQIASFDPAVGAWVLEAGEYVLSIRADAHTELDSGIWELATEVVLPGTAARFTDAATDTLTRAFDPGHRAFTGPKPEDFTADETVLAALNFHVPTDQQLNLPQMPTMGIHKGLKLADMKYVPKTDEKWNTFVQQLTLAELCDLCGNGAWQTRKIRRLGIPATIAPDGSTSMGATIFNSMCLGT